jgi:hypothetical protein
MKILPIRSVLCLLILLPFVSRGSDIPAQVVVAIRYLQIDGTSHSHLYLFDRKAEVMRQLTNEDAGQDHDPVFAPAGSVIIYQRSLKKGSQWRSIQITGKGDRLLAEAPAWYVKHAEKPTCFGDPEAVPDPAGGERFYTASSPGDIVFETRDASSAIILKDVAVHPADSSDPTWYPKAAWLREKGHEQDDAIESFPIFSPSRGKGENRFWTEPLSRGEVSHEQQPNENHGVFGGLEDCILLLEKSPFLEVPLLRAAFFSQHRGSTDKEGLFALDLKTRRLMELAPNGGSIIPLSGLPGFACICNQLYLPLGDGRSVNCDYLDLWDSQMRRFRFAEKKPAQFHGASLLVEGTPSRVISIAETK